MSDIRSRLLCSCIRVRQGSGFWIVDRTRLVDELLTTYFQHSNYSSFVRQLNNYSFVRIKELDEDAYCHVTGLFKKGCAESLKDITRRPDNRVKRRLERRLEDARREEKRRFVLSEEQARHTNTQIALDYANGVLATQISMIDRLRAEVALLQDALSEHSMCSSSTASSMPSPTDQSGAHSLDESNQSDEFFAENFPDLEMPDFSSTAAILQWVDTNQQLFV